MYTIFKYPLIVTDYQTVMMPKGAEIIHVGVQADTICLWAMVDDEAPQVPRGIIIKGTGHMITERVVMQAKHIGTAIMPPFVWHVFDARV